MPRAVNKLSTVAVTRLIKAQKPGLYGDGAGLGLRIGAGGAASWVLRYQRQGVAREMGLGAVHTVGLAEARDRARRFRMELLDGVDPVAQRQASRAAAKSVIALGQVADLYLAAHAPAWRNPAHRRQWRQTLDDYVLPVLGDKSVAEIDTGDVMRVIEPLWHAKPETASRVRGRIEAILGYASARGWRPAANPATWKGHLEALLPRRGKVAAVKHHAALDYRVMPAFMAALRRRTGVAARAAEFCILTATRSSEVRGARWGEIDGAVWGIPAERMKAQREHRIPLPPAAVGVLDDVRILRGWDDGDVLIFPGAKADRPLSDVALSKAVKLAAADGEVTLHGMRSAFRDWAGETTDFPREVVEMALAHRLGTKAEQAYARGDLFQKRRALMEAWGEFCAGRGSV